MNFRLLNKLFLILIDFIFVNISLILALWVRFEGEFHLDYITKKLWVFVFLSVLVVFINYLFSLYNRLWKYASSYELLAVFNSLTIAYVIFSIPVFLANGFLYSRSITVISWLFSILFIGGIRFLFKLVENRSNLSAAPIKKRIVIVGIDDNIAKQINLFESMGYKIVGFIDVEDDSFIKNMKIRGVPILGSIKELRDIIQLYHIDMVIIKGNLPKIVREVLSCSTNLSIEVKILPDLEDIVLDKVIVRRLRDINLEDLLEREEIKIDTQILKNFFKGKIILISGAGGSIGSEIVRQLTLYNPELLLLTGKGENSIYDIALELKSKGFDKFEEIIADVRDRDKMEYIFKNYDIDIVIHAAAHKHVPLMEFNPEEAVKNNIFSTLNLANLSKEYGIDKFIFISTDKAVYPSSIMGATKRFSEIMLINLFKDTKTDFIITRFGNVLGSRGSVVPTFKRQILLGGPITLTDENVKRYFMTIPEAVRLVLFSCVIGKNNNIYVLKLGRMIKILDLAINMIKLTGFVPYKDIDIKIIGLRPGEKLEEKLYRDGAKVEPILEDKILKVNEDSSYYSIEEISKALDNLISLYKNNDRKGIRRFFIEFLKDTTIREG